jgi:hypothetical protein
MRARMYAEAPANPSQPLRIVTEFKVIREQLSGRADASRAGVLTEADRRAFAAELRLDEKHMEVTPEIRKLAKDLAGNELNPVTQARKFFDFVIETSDHYWKWGSTPQGDAWCVDHLTVQPGLPSEAGAPAPGDTGSAAEAAASTCARSAPARNHLTTPALCRRVTTEGRALLPGR